MRVLIRNGYLIDPSQGIERKSDVLIENGKVAAIYAAGRAPKSAGAKTVIDASGLVVAPGFIDIHTHLREPGEEHKETIRTGTAAAAAGGFTAVLCMANTKTVNDNQSVTEFILSKARKEGRVRVFPVGAVTKGLKGESLAEIGELKKAGCVALSDDGNPIMNAEIMRRALEYARMFELPIISHCEDVNLSGDGVANEGFPSTELGLRAIPSVSEDVMVARDVLLSAYTGSRLHIAHVSTAAAVDIISWAKKKGWLITCEVTPHHFTLTDEELYAYDPNLKMKPPLRSKDDKDALIRAMAKGVIDAIATDHAPHDLVVKEIEFDKAAYGIIGLETALPLALELVRKRKLTLYRMVELFTTGPAKAMNLPLGSLRIGTAADITIFDPDAEYVFDASRIHSLSRNTPFLGRTMKGEAVITIVNGRIVFARRKELIGS